MGVADDGAYGDAVVEPFQYAAAVVAATVILHVQLRQLAVVVDLLTLSLTKVMKMTEGFVGGANAIVALHCLKRELVAVLHVDDVDDVVVEDDA